MKKSVFETLYYCLPTAWERRVPKSEERTAVHNKIAEEERYFIEKMSLDDCQRFQELKNLYAQATEMEEINLFSNSFTIGATLMLEIMSNKEGAINE